MQVVLYGNVRKDHFGRIVVDTCESDESHLRNAATDPARNRPICRHLLEDSVAEFLGRRGKLIVTVQLVEEESGAVPAAEMNDATTRQAVTPGLLAEAVLAAVEQVDGE